MSHVACHVSPISCHLPCLAYFLGYVSWDLVIKKILKKQVKKTYFSKFLRLLGQENKISYTCLDCSHPPPLLFFKNSMRKSIHIFFGFGALSPLGKFQKWSIFFKTFLYLSQIRPPLQRPGLSNRGQAIAIFRWLYKSWRKMRKKGIKQLKLSFFLSLQELLGRNGWAGVHANTLGICQSIAHMTI